MKRKVCFVILFMFVAVNMVQAKQPAPYFQKDYRNSFKITFLSWISGSTKLSYERSFPNIRQSGEWCASVIGAGHDKYQNNPKGFTVRYGHKFFFKDHDEKMPNGGVAQLGEHLPCKQGVMGSIPIISTKSELKDSPGRQGSLRLPEQ